MSDRKYSHNGYQDSGKPKGPRQPRSAPEPRPERMEGSPRGRTAGGFGPDAFKCSRCGEPQQLWGEVELESTCARCSNDLRSCSNCRNFDTNARWECRETILARIAPKDRRNECASFAPRVVRDLAADKTKISTPDDARKAFDDLFRK